MAAPAISFSAVEDILERIDTEKRDQAVEMILIISEKAQALVAAGYDPADAAAAAAVEMMVL